MIRELKDAKLLGRGGAAFPTAIKWEAVATNPVRPHYVVCNADESEPGTFKDRVLMEEDPYALLEALTIMGYAAGRSRATSTSAASTRWRRRGCCTRSSRPAPAASSAPT